MNIASSSRVLLVFLVSYALELPKMTSTTCFRCDGATVSRLSRFGVVIAAHQRTAAAPLIFPHI